MCVCVCMDEFKYTCLYMDRIHLCTHAYVCVCVCTVHYVDCHAGKPTPICLCTKSMLIRIYRSTLRREQLDGRVFEKRMMSIEVKEYIKQKCPDLKFSLAGPNRGPYLKNSYVKLLVSQGAAVTPEEERLSFAGSRLSAHSLPGAELGRRRELGRLP